MTSDLSVPCLRCGRPSAPHGEHHEPAKGMGGATAHVEYPNVALCRGCHQALHDKRFTLTILGDFATTWENGHAVSERPLRENDSQPEVRYWSDEALAVGWGQAHERTIPLFAMQCQIAHEFERRYSWLDEWSEGVAQIIGRLTGRVIHPRTVYDRADLWTAFEGRWDQFDYVGARVAISIARASDPDEALELGARLIGEGNHTRTEVAQQITDSLGKRASRGEPCECPECGNKHRRKKET